MNIILEKGAQEPAVCVVDGDPAVRDSLQYLINSNGHPALGFATRAAFIRMLDNRGNPKCVICEAQLPDGSGVEVYKELQERGFNLPFALLVSRRSLLAARRASRIGIEYVWPKPLMDRAPLISFLDG